MSQNLELKVVFSAVDKFLRPVKAITQGASEAAKALKATRDQVRDLNQTMSRIDAFKKLERDAAITANAFKAANERLAALKAQMQNQGATAEMTRAMKKASEEVDALRRRHEQLAQAQQASFSQLRQAGVDTHRLAEYRLELSSRTAKAREETTRLSEALDVENQKMKRLHAARASYAKLNEMRGKMTGAGIGMMVGGGVMMVPVKGELDEIKHYTLEVERIKALGLGEHASADSVKFARAMKTYGISATENLELMRDALTVFADVEHAERVLPTLGKMKFANAAMFGEEKGAERGRHLLDMMKVIEMRSGLNRFEEEANLVQQVLTATGGRVGPSQWLDFVKRAGTAGKLLDKRAFFYRMEPLIQEMTGNTAGQSLMSAYQNLYQGKTTVRAARFAQSLGIYDPRKIEYDKVGQLKRVAPGALKNSALYLADPLAWLEKELLPALARKGITGDQEVINAIGTLFSNRAASTLFSTMYQQRAQIHKNERLSAGADNLDALDAKARNTAQGKELDLLAKKHDLYRELGQQILPTYVAALEMTRDALAAVTGWMKEHPTLAKVMAISFGVLAAGAVVLGGLTIAAAAVLGPFALLRFSITTLGASTGVLGGALGTALGYLLGLPAAFAAGYAFGSLLNAGIDALVSRLVGYKTSLGSVIFDIVETFRNGEWQKIGGYIVKGIEAGLDFMTGGLYSKVTTLAGEIAEAARRKLGIKSPSQVFAEIGAFTMAGLERGIAGNEDGPLSAVSSMARRLAGLTAGIAISGAASAGGIPLDGRAPIAAGGVGAAGPMVVHINIYGAPGQGSDDIQRQVEAALANIEARRSSRARARLRDTE